MFDFSFGEIAVIGAVALVVLGPERLPKVARTAGEWMGKAQRYVSQVKSDINREMELAELKKLQEEARNAAQSVQSGFTDMPRSPARPAHRPSTTHGKGRARPGSARPSRAATSRGRASTTWPPRSSGSSAAAWPRRRRDRAASTRRARA
jgi:sec-independent protein translocase protein TatB